MLNLKKSCPELLRQLPGFPEDGKGTALEDIYRESYFWQAPLREALHWEQTTSHVELPNESVKLDAYKYSTQLMKALLSPEELKYVEENPSALVNNRSASGAKLSKLIAKRVAAGEHVNSLVSFFTKGEGKSDMWIPYLHSELPNYNIRNALSVIEDPMLFVQNFTSELATQSTNKIGFSIDMLEFIRGCNSDKYTSCYTISRTYNSMAPVTMALSGRVGMIFSRNDFTFLGRCWVIFSKDFSSFSMLKSYGFLTEAQKKAAAMYICSTLHPDKNWYMVNVHRNININASSQYMGVYDDPIDYGYGTKITESGDLQIPYSLDITVPKCISCGKSTVNSKILCDECENSKMHRCKVCGNVVFADDTTENNFMCESCKDKYTQCPVCGMLHKKTERCSCSMKVASCVVCGKKGTKEVNGKYLCDFCADVLTNVNGECDICGSKGPLYPHKDHKVCHTCMNKILIGDRFTNTPDWI